MNETLYQTLCILGFIALTCWVCDRHEQAKKRAAMTPGERAEVRRSNTADAKGCLAALGSAACLMLGAYAVFTILIHLMARM